MKKNTHSEYIEVQTEQKYIQCSPIPSTQELSDFYRTKYFDQPAGTYSINYTEVEHEHFKNIAKVAAHTFLKYTTNKSIVDIGCGEGFFIDYFLENNWSIACCDYSNQGLKRQNPKLEPYFIHSGIEDAIEHYRDHKFGAVSLQNVLEHVPNPVETLNNLKALSKDDQTVYRIRVPNDYSNFQKHFMDLGLMANTWFSPPEHISYFNNKNIVTLIENCGYEILSLQADFPIELFLLNPHSNYWKNRDLGKGAHMTRAYCENFLMNQNLDDYTAYSEAAGKIGFGRGLILYCKVKSN